MSSQIQLLSVEDLRTHFDTRRGIVKAVDGVSFQLFSGECLCLVGESGSGKTVTALSLLKLIDSPPGKIEGGKVFYKDADILSLGDDEIRRVRGKEIAFVFQDALSALNPVLTVGEQLFEAMTAHGAMVNNDLKNKAAALLKEVGLPRPEAILNSYPHQLSGGMKQRVMIGMSLSCDPKILIADEPTTAVDVTIQAQILNLLNGLKKSRNLAIIFITHDLSIVSELGDRVLVMYGGKCCELGTVEEVLANPRHPYTAGLISCLPDLNIPESELKTIPGHPPDAVNMPGGCVFNPRCPKVMEICYSQSPGVFEIAPGHWSACHLYRGR